MTEDDTFDRLCRITLNDAINYFFSDKCNIVLNLNGEEMIGDTGWSWIDLHSAFLTRADITVS